MTNTIFRRFALPTLAAATILAATACAAGTSAVPLDTVNLGHVHDLAFDSKAHLYIGSHTGVYRVDADTEDVTLVGGVSFDAMGLTVQGDTLFASGHPDPTDPGPFTAPNIGLVRYDGDEWIPVSLEGTTDFHVLATTPAAPELIVGSPSDQPVLMRTDDTGATWREDVTALTARDIAIDAHDANVVAATTPDGLAVSENGGDSFSVQSGAPELIVIASDPAFERGIVGVDATGQIWTGSTAGGGWTMAGHTGKQPQALGVGMDGALAYADENGISLSRDRGINWQRLPLHG